MRVKVKQLRKAGRILFATENKEAPSFVGDLAVAERRDAESGRNLIRARLKGVSEGTEIDVLPELSDAQLVWAGDGKMRLFGFERIKDADYAQTWAIEVTPC